MAKWLGLFKEIAPGLRHVAVIFNPGNAGWQDAIPHMKEL
jgi:hypothetical protein